MKNNTKSLFLVFFILSGLTSCISVVGIPNNPKVAQTKSFVSGIVYGVNDWDPSIILSSAADYYTYQALETLVWVDYDANPHPLLATSWTEYPRTGGGIQAISFELRQNVYFHDGSEWNATVCQWNLDRNLDISGNQSGTGDDQNVAIFWMDASQFDSKFTANWNLSFYQYDIWGMGTQVPIINKTEIVSDYVINITYNSYRPLVVGYDSGYYHMISMESYSNYNETPIYGVGDNPAFPQPDDPPAASGFPGHMIGTGAYKFDNYNDVTSTGHLIKNDEYWNITALEAEGLYSITDVYVRHFTDDESRTTAALTGELDYISDSMRISIVDHDAVIADPLLNYVPTLLDTSIMEIAIKSEEGLNTPCPDYYGLTPKQIWQHPMMMNMSFPMPAGVNRTVRRALSYAMDYETYLDVVAHGWGEICTTVMGIEGVYYNASIPVPYYNLTEAREILYSDPYYKSLCDARGLTPSNLTDDWNYIADTNPIDTYSMVFNVGHESPIYVESALRDIGFDFIEVGSDDFVTKIIGTGQIIMYDMWVWQVGVSRTEPWGQLNAYFHSKKRMIPYRGYNFGMFANDTIDQLLADIYTSDDPQSLYNQLAYELNNYHVPWLFLIQYQTGFAINAGWTYPAVMSQRIGTRTIPFYAMISGNRMTTAGPPPIPGYDLSIISIASIFTLLGVIYAIMRKNRNN